LTACAPQIGQLSNLFIEDIIRLFELEPLIPLAGSPSRKEQSSKESTDLFHTSERSSQIVIEPSYTHTTIQGMKAWVSRLIIK
jgi:hypothetical protein